MRKGTTPTNIFTTDIDLTGAEEIYLTYEQGPRVIEKTLKDMDVTPETVTVKLTQEETLSFCDRENIKIQFRVKFPEGDVVASNIMTANMGEILKGGVI